jgi:hypothetical protein
MPGLSVTTLQSPSRGAALTHKELLPLFHYRQLRPRHPPPKGAAISVLYFSTGRHTSNSVAVARNNLLRDTIRLQDFVFN